MSVGEIVSWGALASIVLTAFLLGMAPVFVVRWLATLYPKNHPRRRELVAEMSHVTGLPHVLEQWRWLGESFAVALCEGPVARRQARQQRRRARTDIVSIEVRLEGNRLIAHTEKRDIEYRPLTDGEKARGTVYRGEISTVMGPGADKETWVRVGARPELRRGRHRKGRSDG